MSQHPVLRRNVHPVRRGASARRLASACALAALGPLHGLRVRVDALLQRRRDPCRQPDLEMTKPGQPTIHLFKFGGNSAKHTAFEIAMTTWLEGE